MAILVRKRKLVLVRMRVWFSGLSVFGRNAVVAKCQNVGVSAGRMCRKSARKARLESLVSNRSVVTKWSRPIRPTLAAEVWRGSEARRAGARAGRHAMARTKLGLYLVCTTASVYIRTAQPLMGSIYLIYGQISLLHVPTFTKCNVLVASRKTYLQKA
jgi:hypothetical protein